MELEWEIGDRENEVWEKRVVYVGSGFLVFVREGVGVGAYQEVGTILWVTSRDFELHLGVGTGKVPGVR